MITKEIVIGAYLEMHTMRTTRARGFTLIELLTVIAIIAILAAMVFTVGPRMIENAHLRSMHDTMRQINAALTSYLGENNSYPPGYGYIQWSAKDMTPPAQGEPGSDYYYLLPYMATLKFHGNVKLYDGFSESYDTNRNGVIDPMEFCPVGLQPKPTDIPRFPVVLYLGSNVYAPGENTSGPGELGRQLDADSRPFVYVPVNLRQFKRAQKYWIEKGDFYAENWDANDPARPKIAFPASSYDAFVLIGVGPGGNTDGVVAFPPKGLSTEDLPYVYHITALRTYFLATRDLNGNQKLDFDFEARKSGEAKLEYLVDGTPANNMLPPPPAATPGLWGRNGYGPCIFTSQ
jgi:prepilin-type N-terminal cleavage/methylation domain-containing protein